MTGAPRGSAGPPERGSDPESLARLVALDRLSRQPQTRAQLEQLLHRRGVPEEAARAVLDRFTEVGLVDDAAFAAAWVESRHAGRGLAKRALAAELRYRGVASESIDLAVGQLAPADEERAARALVRSRLPATRRLEPPVRARRLLGMLARKGYPSGLALKVVRDELATGSAAAEQPDVGDADVGDPDDEGGDLEGA